jgi:GNAT superfamily N-acetyltransferase
MGITNSRLQTIYFRVADRNLDSEEFESLVLDANRVFQKSFFFHGIGRVFRRGECQGCMVIVGYSEEAYPLSAALLYQDQEPTDSVPEYNLQSVCAHPPHRGSGTQLMKEIVRHVQQENGPVHRIWLTVEQHNPRVDGTDATGDFYRKCGFTVVTQNPPVRRYTRDGIYEYDMEHTCTGAI